MKTAEQMLGILREAIYTQYELLLSIECKKYPKEYKERKHFIMVLRQLEKNMQYD